MYKTLVLFGSLLFSRIWAVEVCAQTSPPVRLSVFSESTSIPYTSFLPKPLHPGAQAGTEFAWRENKGLRLYQTLNVGYLFHRRLFQGIYLNTELGLDCKFGFGLNLKGLLGIGYLHTFATQQEFQFENGGYRSGRDSGNSRIMPSLSLGLGYRLNPPDFQSTEIFVLHQTWLEYPYSPGFIPLMSHTNLHLGTKFYPFKSDK